MINRVIVGIFSMILLSCSQKDASLATSSFKEISSYQINLDRFTSSVEDYIQYLENWKGQEAFAFHVRAKDQIKIYGLESGELLETLAYTAKGPNVFRGIYDFHILNEDSVFLNKRYAYKLYLVNSDYEVIQTLDFLDENDAIDKKTGFPSSKDAFLPVFNRNRLFRKIGDKIYISGAPNFNQKFPEASLTRTLLSTKHLETGEINNLLGFPEKMQGHGWGEFFSMVSVDYSKEEDVFVLSYAADRMMYLTDRNMDIVREFEAFPEGYKDVPPYSAAEMESSEAQLAHWDGHYIFGSAHYDSHRKMIYRVALEPVEGYKPERNLDPLYKPRNMVVMAFDAETFEKRAEMRLKQSEEGVYLDRCFVNERGLNITYVDLENEDQLYFKTFVVE
ncbi:DUF4221 family protein [Algoriphagus sp. NG3]|uniref:DUF4221 family protein n=1 Tax=Algoriphagus sp. NG3 TaxID=3097546 RepID=UPI002A8161FD|nr:DUF4221 family protein [Algoriphagus sp. NG3]WPR74425.1 DUF4221 family protein [Algoriphagus sp. NG3]